MLPRAGFEPATYGSQAQMPYPLHHRHRTNPNCTSETTKPTSFRRESHKTIPTTPYLQNHCIMDYYYQPALGLTDFPTYSVFCFHVRFPTWSEWNYILVPDMKTLSILDCVLHQWTVGGDFFVPDGMHLLSEYIIFSHIHIAVMLTASSAWGTGSDLSFVLE